MVITRLDPLSFWQEIFTFVRREGGRKERKREEGMSGGKEKSCGMLYV